MAEKQMRVRFAPSPTGYLHIGGARTALFNYLFARHHGGAFLLRIEDTDTTRSTDEYIEAIIDGMQWLGLDWDIGPIRQTGRNDVYTKYAQQLIEKGKAYYCYCSAEELEAKRNDAKKAKKTYRYDGKCRELTSPPESDEVAKPVLRFKMPHYGQTLVDDVIKDDVVFENDVLDDFIIVRSDGTPTYNFVVVVDDVDMEITHIIRGDDHLNNTPKQVQLYMAFEKEPPVFAHLPMILGSDKARLSKRHGATSVQAYRELGYLPDALINYLARLGWSFGDQEVFSKDELVKHFTLESVGKSQAVFNPEKLLWLNAHYIKTSAPERLLPLVMEFLVSENIVSSSYRADEQWLCRAISTLQERARTIKELAEQMGYYVSDELSVNEKAWRKFINEKTKPYLEAIKNDFENLQGFTEKELESVFMALSGRLEVKLGQLAQPVRVALTGGTASPGIFEVVDIIGKERTLKRIDHAIKSIEK